MNGKEYIRKMCNSPLYKKMEEYEKSFLKEDGTFDWKK